MAAIGLYSVLAFAVAQRTQELGIRSALGASRRRLVRMVLGKAMRLVAVGMALGLASPPSSPRPRLEPLLFAISPRDPLVLLAVAAPSCSWPCWPAVPAWRATRVDPSVALRAE